VALVCSSPDEFDRVYPGELEGWTRRSSPFGYGSCEKTREGEAPAEPFGAKLLIENGSAGASPSQEATIGILCSSSVDHGVSHLDICILCFIPDKAGTL